MCSSIILINDLELDVTLLKYVDDVMATEVLAKCEISKLQSVVDDLVDWSGRNQMNINTNKTKEMLLGPIRKNPPSLLNISCQPVERVNSFKLLGVTITDSLNWEENINKICSKAGSRLHF